MHKFIIQPILILICFFALEACSESNPLYGSWNVNSIKADDLITQVSIDRYKALQPQKITFSEKEMGVFVQGKEKKTPVQYKKVNEKVWSFSVDGKEWNELMFQDNDTLIRKEKKEDGEITYTLKRETSDK